MLAELPAAGLYARSREFERVVLALTDRVSDGFGDPAPDQWVLPWVIPAELLLTTDYVRSFPNLIGRVFSFAGDDAGHARLLASVEGGDDWAEELAPSDAALCSAGCHPLYPLYAGRRLEAPLRIDGVGHCFRNEPSAQPGRMRTFRQHEQVLVGTPEQAEQHRLDWLTRATDFFAALGLSIERVVANDPFFGRAGRMLSSGQRAQGLKEELVADIAGRPVAIASGNNHLDHFGRPFGITTADGEPAHSSCIGFGLERVTLALMSAHGPDVAGWPGEVRAALWP